MRIGRAYTAIRADLTTAYKFVDPGDTPGCAWEATEGDETGRELPVFVTGVSQPESPLNTTLAAEKRRSFRCVGNPVCGDGWGGSPLPWKPSTLPHPFLVVIRVVDLGIFILAKNT